MALVLVLGCGRQINPAWCAQPGHTDPACEAASDAGADALQLDATDGAQPIDAPDGGDGGDAGTACTKPEDCPASTCSTSGTCVDPDTVLHAAPSGTGTACSVAAPCSFASAIAQAAGARTVIVLAKGTYHGAITIDRDVEIAGNRATIDAAGTGAALTITGNARVELVDLELTGASTASGLACVSGTLQARALQIDGNQQGVTSACALSLERSNVHGNHGGALAVTAGSIDIHDNFLVHNGDATLTAPNVTLAAGVTGSFAFNTVAYNDAKQNADPGLDCRSAVLTLPGNLITDNTRRGAFHVDPQVTGVCDLTGSYTAAGAGGNDLGWVNVTDDFHLTAASTAALDRPGLTCAGRVDYDGDPRPSGAGCDVGADELAP